ncbi:MAG: DsrE family protein [Candidatus Yanofskybacteria bacterium]|nr:DsrE family protein [Candidatus Yanofskybacteria bacterium]
MKINTHEKTFNHFAGGQKHARKYGSRFARAPLRQAKQAKAKGLEVELIFDGGGTQWAAEFPKNDHFKGLYQELLEGGVVKGVCSFCSKAFKVEDELKALGANFMDENNGHPDIGARIASGWETLII